MKNYDRLLESIYEGDIFTKTYKEEREWSRSREALYGEVTREGIDSIISKLKSNNLFKEVKFIDLGCGNGRAVLHLGLCDEVIKSEGVDLFKSKIDFCNNLIEETSYPFKDKINVFYGDALLLDNLNEFNLFLFNNVAWMDETNRLLLNKIEKNSIIVTTFSIKNEREKGIELLEKFSAKYTWNKGPAGPCFLYKKI